MERPIWQVFVNAPETSRIVVDKLLKWTKNGPIDQGPQVCQYDLTNAPSSPQGSDGVLFRNKIR
jgi:hypothetical protein